MSAITNQLSSAFASPNVLSELESGTAPNGSGTGAAPQSSDAIFRGNPISLPIQSPIFDGGGFGDSTPPAYGSNTDPTSIFTSIMNEIGNIVNALLAQLQSSLNSYAPPGAPSAPSQTGNQQLFSSATASSNGDPHLAFDGTTASGTAVQGTWDSMASHGNLLSSDSFAGGYRVSTTVGQPNTKGATTNQSATVTTNGGAAAITMQKDGSYSVTENGQAVRLTQGQPAALGNGETVELNSDGSLTVNDANGQGGTISTTLKSTGGGVDVSNTANDVDLGGYLVDKSDSDYDPVANTGGNPVYGPGTPATGVSYSGSYTLPATTGYTASDPVAEEQFDPDYDNASLSNIGFA